MRTKQYPYPVTHAAPGSIRKKFNLLKVIALVFSLGLLSSVRNPIPHLEEVFKNPPEEAKPWVMWWFQDGNVTREGITADLEAMSANGIGGVYLFTIGAQREGSLIIEKPAFPLSDYWWDIMKYTAREAGRLGLKIALNACDGWATAAAPEITPELSMQELVWSETRIAGGTPFQGILEQPKARLGYYRDLAVWAIPLPVKNGRSSDNLQPEITTSIPGIDVSQLKKKGGKIISDKPGWIQYAFDNPLTCRSVTISGLPDNLYHAYHCQLTVSTDGINWGNPIRLNSPVLGGLQENLSASFSLKPVTGRFFRFEFNTGEFDPVKSGLKLSTGWLPGYYQPALGLSWITLDENPVVEGWQHKNGSLWRQGGSGYPDNLAVSVSVPQSGMINLTDMLQPGGRLKWDAPEGHAWLIQRFGYTTTGSTNGPAGSGKGLEADKFNPASVAIQYQSWFGKAHAKFQADGTDKVLISNHIDSWESRSQNWSPVFREEFINRRGYDPVKYLPVMTGIPVESAEVSERFLNDIRITMSELINDNFLDPYVRMTHQDVGRISVEAMAPVQVADGMAHFGRADLPIGEFWLQSPLHDKPNDIQDAVHAARIYGKNIVGAEAFTQLANQWNEEPSMLKTMGDLNFARGINLFILNAYPHKPTEGLPGMTFWGGLGTEFSRTQPWWKASKAWFDYLSRSQALLQQGNPVVDVLYYTGEYMPVRAWMPDDPGIDLPDGYTFNSINRDALLNRLEVENGQMVLPGGIRCRILVLPADSHMSPEVAEKISWLAEKGVVVTGSKPDRSWSLSGYPRCDEDVRRIVQEGWKKVRENADLKEVFKETGLKPDVEFAGTDLTFQWKEMQQYKTQTMVWSHRKTEEADLYFLSNQEDTGRDVLTKFRITGKIPELWNAETGEIRDLSTWSAEDGQTVIPLQFGPAESFFIVFRKSGKPGGRLVSNFPGYTDLMEIKGSWKVQLQEQGKPSKTFELAEPRSLHLHADPDIRHFSGTAVYRTEFRMNDTNRNRISIDLGDVANIAEVYLDDHYLATLWKPPYRTDLPGQLTNGSHTMEIRVSNTWRNRLVGEKERLQADKTTDLPNFPVQRLNELPLIKSGLLGPVKIQKITD
jgi:hypothetical protein